jgi:hypothetical protein
MAANVSITHIFVLRLLRIPRITVQCSVNRILPVDKVCAMRSGFVHTFVDVGQRLAPRSKSFGALIEKVRFARDSRRSRRLYGFRH